MKKICLLFVMVIAGLGVYSQERGKKQIIEQDNFVRVYYFYTNYRCSSCKKIEKYSRETIDIYFQKELKEGTVIFEMINVEEKGNGHYLNDYELFTKSLVISLVKNGKEQKYKNLEKIWELLQNKKKFYHYVEKEIKAYLKEL